MMWFVVAVLSCFAGVLDSDFVVIIGVAVEFCGGAGAEILKIFSLAGGSENVFFGHYYFLRHFGAMVIRDALVMPKEGDLVEKTVCR